MIKKYIIVGINKQNDIITIKTTYLTKSGLNDLYNSLLPKAKSNRLLFRIFNKDKCIAYINYNKVSNLLINK